MVNKFTWDANEWPITTSLARLRKAVEEDHDTLDEMSIMSISAAVGAEGTPEQIDEFVRLVRPHQKDLVVLVNDIALMAGYHGVWTNVEHVLKNYEIHGCDLVTLGFRTYEQGTDNIDTLVELVTAGCQYDTLSMGWVLIEHAASHSFVKKHHPDAFDLPESDLVLLLRSTLIHNGDVDLTQEFLDRIAHTTTNYGSTVTFMHSDRMYGLDNLAATRPLLHTVVRGGFRDCILAVAEACPSEAKRMIHEGMTAGEYYHSICLDEKKPCDPDIVTAISHTPTKSACE